ncbi:UBN2 domain-containing protein [Cephalotus follicularis]|uniref:UBN2 domain-containing protein n=1 Tax=Cephalotus follicularis TaxID=3775 RepID=A0A1Q3ARP4_CEPFO|nr:UBN2 domain-containing protein [Cephalotus follicularis]
MTYLKAYDQWDTIAKGYVPPEGELPDDARVAQIKKFKEDSTKNFKALPFLHYAVSDTIFSIIVGSSTAKESWDSLKKEFQGSERTRSIRLLHLRRKLVNLKMKE